jgi:hypothetical protein
MLGHTRSGGSLQEPIAEVLHVVSFMEPLVKLTWPVARV